MGDDYTIADIATFPWVRNLVGFYGAGELVGLAEFRHVQRVLEAFVERPAVERGLAIPARLRPSHTWLDADRRRAPRHASENGRRDTARGLKIGACLNHPCNLQPLATPLPRSFTALAWSSTWAPSADN